MADGELEVKLPEGREFYWNKIQGALERAEPLNSRPMPGFLVAWRRLLAPLAGVALVAFLTVYSFKTYDGVGVDEPKHHLAVVENLSEHTGAYSFRSQSENMFVVWIYDRSDEAAGETEPTNETIDQ